MQLHQLDHAQTTRTSLQTDNHTNTSSLMGLVGLKFIMFINLCSQQSQQYFRKLSVQRTKTEKAETET